MDMKIRSLMKWLMERVMFEEAVAASLMRVVASLGAEAPCPLFFQFFWYGGVPPDPRRLPRRGNFVAMAPSSKNRVFH
jgi:hypothetical protein